MLYDCCNIICISTHDRILHTFEFMHSRNDNISEFSRMSVRFSQTIIGFSVCKK